MRLIKFKESRSGRMVYINPDQVVTVQEIPKRRNPNTRCMSEKAEANLMSNLPDLTRIVLTAPNYKAADLDSEAKAGHSYVDVVASIVEVVQRLTKSEMLR